MLDNIETFLEVERKEIEKVHYDNLKSFEKKEFKENEKALSILNQPIVRPGNTDIQNGKKYDKPLYSCFKSILSYSNFMFSDVRCSSKIGSLFHSIFRICMTDYVYLEKAKKEALIKSFIQKMEKDFIERKMYLKNRKLQKTKVLEILRDAYTLQKNDINIHMLKQCICEYMGINIFVFHVQTEKRENNTMEHFLDIYNSEYYLARSIDKEKKPLCFLPTLFIFKENEMYKPILKKGEEFSILTYSTHQDSIDLCWKYFMPVR
jgi:hypothetical protein